jgi:lytic murein transglycosylase
VRFQILAAAALSASSGAALAAGCGGDFGAFLDGLRAEAVAAGISAGVADDFLSGVRQDPAVLKADRAQGVFRKTFIEFSRAVISANRIENGAANARRHAGTLDRALRDYGVSPGVLLAFWALETDYGLVQGDFNTADALVTLAHDCRRPDLFRPEVMAAMELFARGDFDPRRTTGAWAGEIGMVQMLPADILRNGVDGDGDGKVSLTTSPPDALLSGARVLQSLGWRAGEPWLQEVSIPDTLDWSQTGLNFTRSASEWAALGVRGRNGPLVSDLSASLLLPMGRKGPAFLAYPNFRVYFEWNQSFVYVTTAAYFATRLEGAPPFDARDPDPGLGPEDMKRLQEELAALGHDVGKIDGILGQKTRDAVQAEQKRLGLPADAWPTPELLSAL